MLRLHSLRAQKARLSRSAALHRPKMLRDGRMTGLVKLHRSARPRSERQVRADRVREHDHDSLLCTDGFLNIEVVCCCLVEGLAFGVTNAEPLNRPPCDSRHPLPQADRHREPLPRSSSARSKTEAVYDFLCSTSLCQFFIKGTVASGCDQAQTGRRAFRGVRLEKVEISQQNQRLVAETKSASHALQVAAHDVT